MRKMKSKLVRLKVWYEHDDGVSQDDASHALEQLVLQSLTQRDGTGVRVHSFEVGGVSAPPSRPQPDF